MITPNLIDVKISLPVNSDILHTHITASVGDIILMDRRGHSMTRGFIDCLWRYFYQAGFASWVDASYNAEKFPVDLVGQLNKSWVHFRTDFWSLVSAAANITNGITAMADNGAGLIRITLTNSNTGTPTHALVSGVNSVPANGLWALTKISNTQFDLVGSTFSGTFSAASGYPRIHFLHQWPTGTSVITDNPEAHGIGAPWGFLISGLHTLGTGTGIPRGFLAGRSSTPVAVTDLWLYDLLGYGDASTHQNRVQYGAPTRTAPAQVGTQVEMTETRSIVNPHTTETVQIREVGLCAGAQNTSTTPGQLVLISRDIVNIDLSPTASVSITYRLRTITPAAGGFTRQFLELIWREFSNTTREAKNILNSDVSSGRNDDQFAVNKVTKFNGPDLPFESPWLHGIVVGSSTKDVEPADYKLRNADDSDSIILNGVGAGELRYSGGTRVDYPILSGDTVSFDLVRYFENASGGAIDVKEAGLYVNNVGTGANGQPPFCIARNRIDPPVSVPNGSTLRVTYQIAVTVP